MNSITLTAPRKASTALNLSLLSPGLGHVYCGVITRGLLILSLSLLSLIVFVLALALPFPGSALLVWVTGLAVVALTLFGCVDSRQLARTTRKDYRLKDYNRPLVYTMLALISGASLPLIAILLKTWVVEAFVMEGDSYYPTLRPGARVLANKRAYDHADPQRGDTIVFRSPDRTRTWVKRVIALPGDELEIIAGEIWVNGDHISRRTLRTEPAGSIARESIGDHAYEVVEDDSHLDKTVIPPNHVFVLGDHRPRSLDSRHFGPISIFSITGKVTTQIWPLWPPA